MAAGSPRPAARSRITSNPLVFAFHEQSERLRLGLSAATPCGAELVSNPLRGSAVAPIGRGDTGPHPFLCCKLRAEV